MAGLRDSPKSKADHGADELRATPPRSRRNGGAFDKLGAHIDRGPTSAKFGFIMLLMIDNQHWRSRWFGAVRCRTAMASKNKHFRPCWFAKVREQSANLRVQ
jgi:hypothetical protein